MAMLKRYRMIKLICKICGKPDCPLGDWMMAAEDGPDDPTLRIVAVSIDEQAQSIRSHQADQEYLHRSFGFEMREPWNGRIICDDAAVVRTPKQMFDAVRKRNKLYYEAQRVAVEAEIPQQEDVRMSSQYTVDDLFSALREASNAEEAVSLLEEMTVSAERTKLT